MANTRDVGIRVELYERAIPARHALKQGDTTRLIMDVRRGGEPYDLSGLGLLLNVKREDELVYIQTGGYTLDGNVATWALESPIVAEPGQIELETVLTDSGGDVVSSFVFRLNIEPRLLSGDEDIAPEEQDEIIDAARAAALSVTQAREARDAAALSEENAAASEQAAKDSAAAADTSAKAAADSEAKAKASEKSAAQSAASAKNSADTAQAAQKAAESAKNDTVNLAEGANKDADRAESAASAASSDAATAEAAANSAIAAASSAAASATNAAQSESTVVRSASEAAKSAAEAAESASDAAASADRAEQVATANGYAAMEIGEDGCLYLTRTDNIVDLVDFSINDAGELEVVVS